MVTNQLYPAGVINVHTEGHGGNLIGDAKYASNEGAW